VLTANSPLSLPKGTTAILNGTQLRATDPEQNPGQLIYTLTRLPEAGLLQLNGTRPNIGATFTQTDIDTGRLSYSSFGRNQRLTNNNRDEFLPKVSGSNAMWHGTGGSDGGTDTEIFFFNGSIVTQLTTNNTEDFEPQISGTNIAWSGTGGSDGGTDTEIFFFNGSTVSQLTSNTIIDLRVQVSGSNVIWGSYIDSDVTSEIFFGNVAPNDNFGFTIADGAGGVTNGTFTLNLV
jgi:Cadherin-like